MLEACQDLMSRGQRAGKLEVPGGHTCQGPTVPAGTNSPVPSVLPLVILRAPLRRANHEKWRAGLPEADPEVRMEGVWFT